ncbi:hypothetical protein [Aurantiacibacter poecillastricola]|uniref:hypothetical protein n=1 Tax=Aurantiacibacter poecillastricola TaxID=3064385 RepID=UPI00273DCE08|nr:hypothetical protein [Aurantiacibacter sp. 219JJ12-13]MDP5260352.1 hypothetical protein [Aurantiacibacter sp. 219JJ12-13]
MSRRSGVIFGAIAAIVLMPDECFAQEVYGPVQDEETRRDDTPVPLVEPERCEEGLREDGSIVVCREVEEPERYMSPLPRPVEVRINQLDGLREPPCWVTGKKPCMRIGSVPPYPPMVDTTAFPEPLSEEEAAAVFAAEDEGETRDDPVTGERVPIDLSDDD